MEWHARSPDRLLTQAIGISLALHLILAMWIVYPHPPLPKLPPRLMHVSLMQVVESRIAVTPRHDTPSPHKGHVTHLAPDVAIKPSLDKTAVSSLPEPVTALAAPAALSFFKSANPWLPPAPAPSAVDRIQRYKDVMVPMLGKVLQERHLLPASSFCTYQIDEGLSHCEHEEDEAAIGALQWDKLPSPLNFGLPPVITLRFDKGILSDVSTGQFQLASQP